MKRYKSIRTLLLLLSALVLMALVSESPEEYRAWEATQTWGRR